MYTIAFRPDLDLIDVRWTDLFTVAGVAAYATDLVAGFHAHGFRPGYRLRIDMTGSAPQPRDVLDPFLRHMHAFPKARRIAVVAQSALLKMQVRRLMTQPYLRLFEDAAPALDWLLDDGLDTRAVA